MKDNFEQCFALVLKTEGGFQDDPHDLGNVLADGRPGCTNMGVTQATWEAWVGHMVTHADMGALTPNDVLPLYKKNFWDGCNCDDMPYGLDYALYDLAVNSGVRRAIRFLQQVLGVTDDGVVGPATMAAINGGDDRDLIRKLCDKRLNFLRGIPSWSRYSTTWGDRIASVEKTSLSMVG
jgi:lysozyme family protein